MTVDDRLLKQAKLAALRSGRTVSDLGDDGLRLLLNRTKAADPSVQLPVFGGSGLRPGVDLCGPARPDCWRTEASPARPSQDRISAAPGW